jgi:hypothetical protein
MRDADEKIAVLRETLEYLPQGNIPAEYKRVLIETMEAALESALQKAQAGMNRPAAKADSYEWRPEEVLIVETFLKGKVAANWQHADEQLMHLAGLLHRPIEEIKNKASELGLGVGVDYRQAKQLK